MLWHRQAIFELRGEKLFSSAECRVRSWEFWETKSPADLRPSHKPTALSRIKLKTWTRQPIPMMSGHSAHLTSLPIGFRTWLWRYICLLLFMLMLWHRQAIFELKGDKLFRTKPETSLHLCIRRVSTGDKPTDFHFGDNCDMVFEFQLAVSHVFLIHWLGQFDSFISYHMKWYKSGWLRPAVGTIYFLRWKFNCHFVVHCCSSSMSSCISLQASSVVMLCNSFTSPANYLIGQTVSLGMSFMKIIKKKGLAQVHFPGGSRSQHWSSLIRSHLW